MDRVVVVTVRTQRGQQPLSWHLDVSQFIFIFYQTAIICRSLGIIGHRIRLKLLNALYHASVLTLGRFYPPRLGPPVAAQTAQRRCWIPAVQLCSLGCGDFRHTSCQESWWLGRGSPTLPFLGDPEMIDDKTWGDVLGICLNRNSFCVVVIFNF